MQKLIFIIFLFCLNIANAQRNCDLGIEITNIKAGDTIKSPQNAMLVKCKIYNNGPDTLKPKDQLRIVLVVQPMVFASHYYYPSKDIAPGGYDSTKFSRGFTGNVTTDSALLFVTLYSKTPEKTDTLVTENKNTLNNNVYRVFFRHVGYTASINQNKNNIYLYPNPATQVLNIYNINPNYEYEILNSNFQSIIKKNSKDISASQIDISYLTQGFYILKLSYNNELYILKFIKQ